MDSLDAELREFLASDAPPPELDSRFKEALRAHLWALLQRTPRTRAAGKDER